MYDIVPPLSALFDSFYLFLTLCCCLWMLFKLIFNYCRRVVVVVIVLVRLFLRKLNQTAHLVASYFTTNIDSY